MIYVRGKGIKVHVLKDMMDASYHGRNSVHGYHLDRSLSRNTSKVYVHPATGHAVIAHQGTHGLKDWTNNAIYALGGMYGYKKTQRYLDAKRVHMETAAKFGAHNISTIGHSQGGIAAEMLGHPTKEIITLNKATRPFTNYRHSNQYDIRTKNDIVSALNPFQRENGNEIIITSNSYHPVSEHTTNVLSRLDSDKVIGKGLQCAKICKSGQRCKKTSRTSNFCHLHK